MPMGTGAATLQTIPVGEFVPDPQTFFSQTVRNQERIDTQSVTLGRPLRNMALPQVGIVQKVRFFISGTLTVAPTETATPTAKWPYGLVDDIKLSANGQNDLHSYTGIDAHVMRSLRYPAYSESLDVFPGAGGVGGGPGGRTLTPIAAGTYPVHLTYEMPIATDETSLVGGLFLQSSAANTVLRRRIADIADLFSAGAEHVTMDLTCYTHEVYFEVPLNSDGALVVPDLTRLHAINAVDWQFSGVGPVDVPMIRSAGQLHRLLVTVNASPTNRLEPSMTAPAADRVDALRLMYGGNKRPLDYDPISDLQAQSNAWYGSVLPYDAMCLDLVRENPQRDILLLQGVTELKVVPVVNPAVTVSGGTVHLVQQTLFQGG